SLDANGMPEALSARICSQSVQKGFLGRNPIGVPLPPLGPFPDKTNVEGLHDQPYAIPHCRVEHVEAENEVPVGNWRSVGHSFNGFAMECFLDELARAGRRDPLEMRKCLLQRYPEKVALLDRLREFAQWKPTEPAGGGEPKRGRGLAYRQNFGSDVAQVVDIAVEHGRVRVERVF